MRRAGSWLVRSAVASEVAGLAVVFALVLAGFALAIRTEPGQGGPVSDPSPVTAGALPVPPTATHARSYILLVRGDEAAAYARGALAAGARGRWEAVAIPHDADPAVVAEEAQTLVMLTPAGEDGTWPVITW